MIYANNQVGFSLMEYLIVKTDGSSKEKKLFLLIQGIFKSVHHTEV